MRIVVQPDQEAEFTVALRIPGWCRKAALRVNGKAVGLSRLMDKGYAKITRTWKRGDRIDLALAMPVERIEANPNVGSDCGRVALLRGPVLYCLEEVDNGPQLNDIALPRSAKLRAKFEAGLLGGVAALVGRGVRRDGSRWAERLYQDGRSKTKSVPIKAVPYCVWDNRKAGEMLVWVREQ